jgi:hypothetical protein
MSQDVYANPAAPLSVIGGGGGGGTVPGNLPEPAVVGSPTSTSITMSFDVAGVTGTEPITYVLDYSTGGGAKVPVTLTIVGTVYTGTASGLTPSTSYQFTLTATNAVGETSATPVSVSTAGGAPTPVGNLPPVEFTSAGISSISVYIDTAAVTGSVPIAYTVRWTSTSGVPSVNFFDQAGNFAPSTGTTIQTFTAEQGPTRDISPGTVYYWGIIAVNSVSQTSTIAPFPAYSTLSVPAVPPLAPSAPQFSTATTNSLSFLFSTPTQTTPAPGPQYSYYIGTSSNPIVTGFDAQNVGGPTLLASTFTGNNNVTLSTNTVYYVQSAALQTIGGTPYTVSSSATAMSTIAAGPATLLPPSPPELITAGTGGFSYRFSTPTQTTEAPGPLYTVFATDSGGSGFDFQFGPTLLASTFTGSNGGVSLNSDTVYDTYALAQQTIGASTIYASSSVTAISTLAVAPVAQSTISTLVGVGFLTFGTGGFSSIILDTSQNAEVGNWQADGVITYGAAPANTGPQYLSSVKARGNKIILSMGGANSTDSVLSTMFGLESGGNADVGAANLADSLAYAYFGGPSSNNPLGFGRGSFEGFVFDGLDLDIEHQTPQGRTLQVFTSTLKANPGFAGKIVTAAPQTPYLTQGAGSGLNANGSFTSFFAMNPGTILNEVYTGNAGDQDSLFSPTHGNLIDYHFVQAYNNASYSYPTGANSGNWNNVVAAWGIQSLQSGYPGAHPKNIMSFATTDGTPIFDPVGDAAAFNASLLTANSTIRAFSTSSGVLPFSSINVSDWCAGIGFWAANTNVASGSSSLPVISTMYGQPSTLSNMPTDLTMTYGGVFNSDSWGLIAGTPIPNGRGY